MWRLGHTQKRGEIEKPNEWNNQKEIVMELKVNIVAVLVAVTANFVLGFVWYAVLFASIWGKEMGYDPNNIRVLSVAFRCTPSTPKSRRGISFLSSARPLPQHVARRFCLQFLCLVSLKA
jgi:hypothetical protein